MNNTVGMDPGRQHLKGAAVYTVPYLLATTPPCSDHHCNGIHVLHVCMKHLLLLAPATQVASAADALLQSFQSSVNAIHISTHASDAGHPQQRQRRRKSQASSPSSHHQRPPQQRQQRNHLQSSTPSGRSGLLATSWQRHGTTLHLSSLAHTEHRPHQGTRAC